MAKQRARHQRKCIICGFSGYFDSFGYNLRVDAACPECKSLERHRLLKLWFERVVPFESRIRLIHFAAEECVTRFVAPLCETYVSADLSRADADVKVNIEQLGFADGTFDALICLHVLEHVDDRKALSELHRILVPGGRAILAVPVVEGWEHTYANPAIISAAERLAHFGQEDHLRRYGRDFRDRVHDAGFDLVEFSASGEECATYSLLPGDRIFVAHKRHGTLRKPEAADRIIVSAPGRIDLAGRFDIPRYWLQFPPHALVTCNIAIDLRTTITYARSDTIGIRVSDGATEEYGAPYADPESSTFPYFWLAARHFAAPAGSYLISTTIPRSSGLGGSSAFVLALLAICLTAQGHVPTAEDQQRTLMTLAYIFENESGATSAGFQDYLAALYGGANSWAWGGSLGKGGLVADRGAMCSWWERHLLADCIVVAFTGEPHTSNRLDSNAGFRLHTRERHLCLTIANLARAFGALLRKKCWAELAALMREERELWMALFGQRMSARSAQLAGIADAMGVGARFAGFASGGSVWAIGSPADVAELYNKWQKATQGWRNSSIRLVQIDSGLRIDRA